MYTMRSRNVFRPGGPAVATQVVHLVDEVTPHVHDFLEIVVVVDGSGVHRTASGDHRLRRGTVLVIRPGGWHGYLADESLDIVNLCIGPMAVHDELSWVLGFPHLALALLGAEDSRGVLPEDALTRVLMLVARLDDWGRARPASVVFAVVSVVLSELVDVEFAPSVPAEHGPLSRVVREGMLLVARDLARPWTMADLSRELSVSDSRLYRSFRAQTGSSPLAWLAQFRGEQAATLLTQTDLPVSAIGRQVGWADPNYCSRRFRELYGIQPSEYRRRFRDQSLP